MLIQTSDIIAGAALFIAGYTAWLARKSAILGVRPKLVAGRHTEITNEGRTLIFEFSFENVGVGPAMYRDIRLFFKDEPLKQGLADDLPLELFRKCLPSGVWPNLGKGTTVRLEKHGLPAKVGALRPGDRFLLARVRFDSDVAFSDEARAKIREMLNQSDYRVDYTSIYEEQVWTCKP